MLSLIKLRRFSISDLKLTNKNILILSHFIPDILLGLGWATIHKVCVELLPAQWLSFEQLMISIFLITACFLWKNEKFRKNTISIFLFLSIFEMLTGMVMAFSMVFSFNVWVYAIGSLLYTGLISVFLSRIEIAFKSKLFVERDRENFDNDMELAVSSSSLIGFGVASLIEIPLNTALILWGIAWIGNLGWIMVYLKNKNALKKL